MQQQEGAVKSGIESLSRKLIHNRLFYPSEFLWSTSTF